MALTNPKKKILMLGHDQFGESTTTFKQCEFARDTYDITYIGWDYGTPKFELPNVNVKYISRESNLIVRNLRFFRAFHKEIRNGYDIVFVKYIRFIALLRLFNRKANFVVYVDTLGVMQSRIKRFIFDFTLKLELSFFKNIALISKGIGQKLGIKKFHVLPLGGDCYATNKKEFERLSLLYVGTLANRNILETVIGFHRFIDEQKRNDLPVDAEFVIVGNSYFDELKEIRQYIIENDLEGHIKTTGYLERNRLHPFFEKANIGVSYVPIRPYYQHQPPTKTYEYLISGLPVIATKTAANVEIISDDAGVLINDDPESFFNAICAVKENKNGYDSDKLRAEYEKHTWQRVVNDNFIPLIEELLV